MRDHRSVPFSSAFGDDNVGPTVDQARFQDVTGRFPGGWREFPRAWPTPENEALAGETRSVIARCLAGLPDRQRAVMELRDVQGYEPDEVCDLLDLSPGNQRVLLHRARAAVRLAVEIYFDEPPRAVMT